ncbi:hypothetical protein F2Q68_00024058 [Brassica cretica]|uniref:Uncharacterized protein n=1 Tax=Brassica cretica TaxID=69181 RepID=A0A8S9I9B7_BRACR|nr:hypothetical protein F2Q68_00024058 [Brassica cretica]
MLTATGHRVDMFTSEEQELLSDVEPVMRRLRNIMHHSGYTDGEPISDDDKTYVLEQIFNFHPEKESKLGSGLDFITCINNYLVEKYPNLAEEFIAKYYKKRDNANRVRNSQDNNTPPGNSSTGEKEPVSNGGEDSETQAVGNGGGDSETQAQPIGDGGEDTETQP